jgi:hypothetical protein
MASYLRWETATRVSLPSLNSRLVQWCLLSLPIVPYDEDLASCSWLHRARTRGMHDDAREVLGQTTIELFAAGRRRAHGPAGRPVLSVLPFTGRHSHSTVDGHGTTACTDRRWIVRGTPASRAMPHGRIDRYAVCRSDGPGRATCPVARGTARLSRRGHAPLCSGTRRDQMGRRRVLAPHGRARPCACRRGARPVLRAEPGARTAPGGQAQAMRDTGWWSSGDQHDPAGRHS